MLKECERNVISTTPSQLLLIQIGSTKLSQAWISKKYKWEIDAFCFDSKFMWVTFGPIQTENKQAVIIAACFHIFS